MDLPKKYKSLDNEHKWSKSWEESQVYKYDPSVAREETYVVDTPPPTVSGSLHVGHVFSYTQTDIMARFKRMNGLNVFYPIGWDDNGLPTERRVQSLFGIRCNPLVAHDPNWEPVELNAKEKAKAQKEQKEVSRENFLKACEKQTLEDEKKYEALWRHLGLSYDWSQQYSTINSHCQKISQASFLDLVEKGQAYGNYAPTMWDTTFQTAVAQAEVEEREKGGHYHDITFQVSDGEEFTISTTRPELLPACIAVVAHPDDERYSHLFGKTAKTPLFHAEVPIMPAEHADPEKGTGILMVCTFGDTNDVEFWKSQKLPLKQIIGRNGKLIEVEFGEAPFVSSDVKMAQENYQHLVGLYAKQARKKIAEMLAESGAMKIEPKPTQQFTKFYEKGDEPLEFIATRQWFIKILEHKQELINFGAQVTWHPEHMYKRYQTWVEGLNQDWCVSRQRFFGVPFPVWYKLDEQGEPDYQNPIYAKKESLPIDPQAQAPEGFEESQRGQPGGFIGDPDVMDTWATSSVSPQINSHWNIDESRHQKLFPADLRPQAHEIIRTWAFYTIVKAWMHEKKVPWHNIAISGWVVNPDRKKMSKSKGNTVTPEALIEQYSSDALRYWAGKARLGQDTIYDENVFKIGQRLGTKIFNASKFVLMQLQSESGEVQHFNPEKDITQPIDKAWKQKLENLIQKSTQHFEKYEYSLALSQIESDFWDFCDFYIELVKSRAYSQKQEAEGISAMASLEYGLKVFLKLFAPFMPFVTEEVWSWAFQGESNSIHKSAWPTVGHKESSSSTEDDQAILDLSRSVLNQIRGAKSTAQKSLKWPVSSAKIGLTDSDKKLFELVESDLIKASNLLGQFEVHNVDAQELKQLDKKAVVEVILSETKDG